MQTKPLWLSKEKGALFHFNLLCLMNFISFCTRGAIDRSGSGPILALGDSGGRAHLLLCRQVECSGQIKIKQCGERTDESTVGA